MASTCASTDFKRWVVYRIVPALFLLILNTSLTSAQQFASLQGTVKDSIGAVVSGATVTITSGDTSASRAVTTDDTGSYRFQQVQPSTYSLRVEAPGFRALVREQVQLLVATPTTLNIELETGQVSEQVTVSSEVASTINTVDATVGNPIKEEEIKKLPFSARNPLTMLTLQPGVVFTGESDNELLFQGSNQNLDDREGVVNGIRGNQSNVTIDGANANDFETQAAFTSTLPVTLDSLQEFRVTTSNANSTDGLAGGAQVQLVTKSGSNAFHGNLREYNRNTATAANSYFNNLAGIEKPKLIRNIFGGSLGGPVVKERAFFFLDYEGRRISSEESVDRIVPSTTFKQGIFKYRANNGSIVSLNAAELQAIDPRGIGANPAMLRYFALYPEGNDPGNSPDGGLNYSSLRFNAPVTSHDNLYTARFDLNVTEDGRHKVFWRGTLGDIKRVLDTAQFPGLPASSYLLNNSKGFVTGYTALFGPSVSNTFRWGFTRQGVENTGAVGDYFNVNKITPFFPGANEYGGFPADPKGRKVPINEFANDLTWLRGRHTIQTGALVNISRNKRFDRGFAYPYYNLNAPDCVAGCRDAYDNLTARLNGGANSPLSPASLSAFNGDIVMITGAIPSIRAAFQADPKNDTIFAQGNGRVREFAENGVEVYLQDSWRARHNLTITAGLRYSYHTPIWEVNGRMLRPSIDVAEWWDRRQADMYAGVPSDASPLISYVLAGKANDQPAWYKPDRNNFAPRLSIAWSPEFDSGIGRKIFGASGKSSLRAGFGVYYQRVGSTLAITTDRWGNPGLSTLRFSPRSTYSLATAPRFSGTCDITGCAGLPPITAYLTPPTDATVPFTPASNGSNFHFMVDNNLKTPYSMNTTVSFQRELPKRFLLDVGYVGTLGRQLLNKLDGATPYGYLKDTASGQTLWGAYNQLIDYIGPNPQRPNIDAGNPAALARIAPIAFFQNMLPNLPAAIGRPNLTPTQAFYVLAANNAPVWTEALYAVDSLAAAGGGISPWNSKVDPQGDGGVLLNKQYGFLPIWFNKGRSDYDSMQVSLRRNIGSALLGVNYVFSKSLDNGSAAENSSLNNGTFWPSTGIIYNPFQPYAHRAPSDYDVTHNFNAHWVIDLPVGRGRYFAKDAGGLLNQIIGGWTTTGVWRWRSGFPITPEGNDGYFSSAATLLTGIESNVTKDAPDNRPNLFSDPASAKSALGYTRPGDVGSRNVIRGPGYFNVDLGLYKRFRMPWSENQSLELRGTVFNAFNNANFSIRPPNYGHTFRYYEELPNFGRLDPVHAPREGAREFEFALRFAF